ncbi:metallophosphoesterase, partial [Nocardia carnea]|uniref:metallophosphoesterase n=1 Tax=Nocardia carnea TaxID=37328 RepID=UPI002458B229
GGAWGGRGSAPRALRRVPSARARAPLSRRMLISRMAAGATVLTAGAVVGIGTYGVLDGPMVRRVTVPLAKLPAQAHGLRIALVSDLHLGPALGRGFCERVVRTVNETRPDLIALVGDLTDGSVADLRAETEPLAGFSARLGTFFVPGNHEYYSDADAWLDRVGELGMRVLLNDRVSLPDFDLAGVDDPAGSTIGRGPDFAAALDGRDTERACVLLAHQPVVVHDSVRYGVDLQLSGHTHGGQLWPGNLLARLANPTVAGLELYGATALYVTRGAGAWGPPVRVAAPSDITVLELASLQGV